MLMKHKKTLTICNAVFMTSRSVQKDLLGICYNVIECKTEATNVGKKKVWQILVRIDFFSTWCHNQFM